MRYRIQSLAAFLTLSICGGLTALAEQTRRESTESDYNGFAPGDGLRDEETGEVIDYGRADGLGAEEIGKIIDNSDGDEDGKEIQTLFESPEFDKDEREVLEQVGLAEIMESAGHYLFAHGVPQSRELEMQAWNVLTRETKLHFPKIAQDAIARAGGIDALAYGERDKVLLTELQALGITIARMFVDEHGIQVPSVA